MFHADRRANGQTDTKRLIVASRNFAKPPENTILKNALFGAVKQYGTQQIA